MTRITIEDVAKEAKISTATVSRVIHNNGYVSKKSRNIILSAIKKLGYVPNKVASGLRSQKTNIIGHVMGLSSFNPLSARYADAIHEVFEKAGYHVLTVLLRGSGGCEQTIFDDLMGQMVDAIIINAIYTSENDIISRVVAQGVPVVMIERFRDISGIDIININNLEGAATATRHLIANGHLKIAFIGVYPGYGAVEKQRFAGFKQTMDYAGLEVPEHFVHLTSDYTIDCGYRVMESIYYNGDIPTALFTTSDLLACGALQSLYKHNIKVPDDISIVGYDNTLSRSGAPPFSSIEMHPEMIGEAALKMIEERNELSFKETKQFNITPTLIDRNSVITV